MEHSKSVLVPKDQNNFTYVSSISNELNDQPSKVIYEFQKSDLNYSDIWAVLWMLKKKEISGQVFYECSPARGCFRIHFSSSSFII